MGKHKDTSGTSGDGQQALHDLVNKYDKVTDEVMRSIREKLVSSSMKRGQDPDDSFPEKNLARSERDTMGLPFFYRRSKNIGVQASSAEYNDIKLMKHRDPTLDIDKMQSTIRHLCLNDPSRNDRAKAAIAGLTIAITADISPC